MSKIARLERQRDELINEKRKLIQVVQLQNQALKSLKERHEKDVRLRSWWQRPWYKRMWGALRGLTL